MNLATQIIWLFVLSIPIACVAWTVTHEEIFKEPRDYCTAKSKNSKTVFSRKMFYLFTCEYCFSHYVTLFFIITCNYKLLINAWQGYVIAEFSLVFIANLYMSLFGLIRQDIKKEKCKIEAIQTQTNQK
ncbi:MAG: hypothetical protein H7174_03480 [Flavobacterium sp.]|nr:hypothetical protein [Flavobacterium sp.]